MTQDSESDMALTALLAATHDNEPRIPEELVRNAYAIQRRHQFDREEHRDASLQELQNLVDEFIDSGSAP